MHSSGQWQTIATDRTLTAPAIAKIQHPLRTCGFRHDNSNARQDDAGNRQVTGRSTKQLTLQQANKRRRGNITQNVAGNGRDAGS